jgi:hypothetical protein
LVVGWSAAFRFIRNDSSPDIIELIIAFSMPVSGRGELLPPAALHLSSALALPVHVASVRTTSIVVAVITIRPCIIAPIEFVATA